MFRDISWFSVLLGMNFDFNTPTIEPEALNMAQRIRDATAKAVAEMSVKLPNHFAYLRDQVYCC
jgi:hypothetical protein